MTDTQAKALTMSTPQYFEKGEYLYRIRDGEVHQWQWRCGEWKKRSTADQFNIAANSTHISAGQACALVEEAA